MSVQFIEQKVMSQVFDTLFAVRTEICCFLLAFIIHYFMLGRSGRGRKGIGKKVKMVSNDFSTHESDKDSSPFSKDPLQVLERSQAAFERGDHRAVLRCWSAGGLRSSGAVPAAHLAHIVESMQRFKKDSASILAEVTSYLEQNANASSAVYINRLLEPLAKSLDIEVVDGIVKLLPSIRLQADSKTFEILIQMRFTTRSFDEIDTLSKQMKLENVEPTRRASVMLLKTALQTGKLDEALERFSVVAAPVEGMPPTASEAPAHIAVQLVELACRLHRPEAVVAELESSKMAITTESYNTLLAETSRARDPELTARVERLATKLSVGRDGRTYQTLVRGAGGDHSKISALLDDMAEKKIACTQEVGAAVLSACVQSGDVVLADRFYKLLGADTQGQVPILQALVRFYVDAGQGAKACEVFDSHLRGAGGDRRALLDTRTERSLLSAAVQCGREDVASAILASAPSDTAKHISIIRSCAAKGSLREAMCAFRSLQTSGADMTQSLWNTALDVCVEGRDLDQARALMKEIEGAGMADAVTYNTLIKAHLRTDSLEGARGLMNKMRKAGCAPNHVTYNELINSLVRNERDQRSMQTAWEVVEEMKQDGVQPNRITCSILLKSLKAKSSGADINRTMELTNQMQEPMDEVLMSSVVEACVRIGKPQLLSQKLSDLHRNGSVTVTGAQTFGSLIKAYGHAHDIAGAWRCWKEMRSRHVKPTCVTIGCMVEAVATSGDVDGAYELICQLLEDDQCKDQINSVIFGSVVKGYGRMRRMERVTEVFSDMMSRGIQPSITTYNAVIDACARSGRMDSVPKLMQDMRKQGLQANLITYSTMIKGFSQHGDMPSALATLRDLRKTPGLTPDGIVYNTVLEGCAQAGLVAEGERLFKEMQDEGVVPTNYTLTVMVRLMSLARRADKAFELVESLTRKYRFRANSHVSNALIQVCIASRDLPRAMAVFDQMVSDRQLPDSRTRQSLVRGLLGAGSNAQAAQVMRAVLRITSQGGSNDQQPATWGAQEDQLLAEVLGALAESPDGRNLVRPLLSEARAAYPRNPSIERLASTA